MRKYVPLFALVLIFALVFAGCDAQPNSPSQAVASVSTPQTQTVQTWEGYTAELVSTIPENHSVYVTLRITAPEDVDVSPWIPYHSETKLSLRNLKAISTANDEEAFTYYQMTEDAQGRKHVLNMILQVRPVALEGESSPFGPGNSCKITFDAMVLRQNQEETVLACGDWQFSIDLSEWDTDPLELLTQPVTSQALVTRNGETEFDILEGSEEVTLTSLQLRPTTIAVEVQPLEQTDDLNAVFLDTSGQDEERMYMMMKDGSKIFYFQTLGAEDTVNLKAHLPVDFQQADYLCLPGGVQIPIPPPEINTTAPILLESGRFSALFAFLLLSHGGNEIAPGDDAAQGIPVIHHRHEVLPQSSFHHHGKIRLDVQRRAEVPPQNLPDTVALLLLQIRTADAQDVLQEVPFRHAAHIPLLVIQYRNGGVAAPGQHFQALPDGAVFVEGHGHDLGDHQFGNVHSVAFL